MKYLVISDIHLAHRQTPTSYVIENLNKYVLTKENSDIDVFFIAGDLYDRSIEVTSKENREIMVFLGDLLEYCYQHKIKLRALKGTPGHEWDQLRILGVLNNQRGEKAVNYKYFDYLDIEYMSDHDKHILYIPDEWSDDHSLIERQIEDKMKEMGIASINIAILHSLFGYQMAGIPYNGFRYDENYFLNIISEYIIIGHVHTHSNFDRIIAGGGFDRYRHGEDGEKGYIVIDGDEWYFKRNENPYVYETIDVSDKEDIKSLDKKIFKFPKKSHIRLRMTKDHPMNISYSDLKVRYMDYNLTRIIVGDGDNNLVANIIDDVDFSLDDFSSINLNLKEVLRNKVMERVELTDTEVKKLDSYLEIFKMEECKEELE